MDEADSEGLWHQGQEDSFILNNETAIKIAHNPMQHSRTKHIAIGHHFIRDHVAREDIVVNHVNTKDSLADIFTKPLDEKRLCVLRCELNILDFANV